MPSCAVFGCRNYHQKTKGKGLEIKYFSFPKDVNLAQQWVIACRRSDWVDWKSSAICSVHFDSSCFAVPLRHQLLNYSPKNSRYLKADALPTEHLPTKLSKTKNLNHQKKKTKSLKKRCSKISNISNLGDYVDVSCESRNIVQNDLMQNTSVQKVEAPVDSNMINSLQNKVCGLENTVKLLEEENKELKISLEELKMQNSLQNKVCGLENTVKLLEEENKKLKINLEELKRQNTAKRDYNDICEAVKEILSKIFTPGQIRMLMNPEKTIHFEIDDIAAAISLYSVSPKAYKYLRQNNYPLPAVSTLQVYQKLYLK